MQRSSWPQRVMCIYQTPIRLGENPSRAKKQPVASFLHFLSVFDSEDVSRRLKGLNSVSKSRDEGSAEKTKKSNDAGAGVM